MNIFRAADDHDDLRKLGEIIHNHVYANTEPPFAEDVIEAQKHNLQAALVALDIEHGSPDHEDYLNISNKDADKLIQWIEDRNVNIAGWDGDVLSNQATFGSISIYDEFFESTKSESGDEYLVDVDIENLGKRIKDSSTARGLDRWVINDLGIEKSEWAYLTGRQTQSINRNLRR